MKKSLLVFALAMASAVFLAAGMWAGFCAVGWLTLAGAGLHAKVSAGVCAVYALASILCGLGMANGARHAAREV